MGQLDQLLATIRTERFILWAGAGMSFYAGYPSAKALGQFLNSQLGEDAQPEGTPLDQVANIYQSKFGRDQLINMLWTHFFLKGPKSFEYHEMLAGLPVFHTIITTNYDPLFELGYRDDMVKICSMMDFPKLHLNKRRVIKIHSDFSQPDKIVITRDDYARFLAKDSKTLFYDYVQSELATNQVLLIGYSFEDLNAMVLQMHIDEQLNEQRRDWWLISPGMKDYQLIELAKRGIQVIDMTAEKFIDRLKLSFQDHIIEDHAKQKIGSADVSKFLLLNNIASTIKLDHVGASIVKVEPADKSKPYAKTAEVTLEDNPRLVDAIEKLADGTSFADVKLEGRDIADFSYRINDIRFSRGGVKALTLQPVPMLDFAATLAVGAFRITKANFKFFRSDKAAEIRIIYHNLSFGSMVPQPVVADITSDMKIDIQNRYLNSRVGYEIYSFIVHARQLGQFSVSGNKLRLNFGFNMRGPHYTDAERLLNHFTGLRNLEKFFNVRFVDVVVTEEAIFEVERLNELIDGRVGNFSPLKITMETINLNLIKEAQGKPIPINSEFTQPSPALYGVQLPPARYTLDMEDGVIINVDKLLANETKVMEITSEHMRLKITHAEPV